MRIVLAPLNSQHATKMGVAFTEHLEKSKNQKESVQLNTFSEYNTECKHPGRC